MEQRDQSANIPAATRSSATVAVDNVIRRALRVSNPDNAEDVARALLDRYQGDAAAITRESKGEAVVRLPAPIIDTVANTASRAEVLQAREDLDRDLDALVHESQLKDIESELRGWSV